MSRCTKKNCPMVGVSADCDLKDCPYRTEADQSKDAIYREDTIKAIEELFDMGGCYCDRYSIRGAINSMPSADRPQGYWAKTDVATYRCSECGKIQIADDINELNFCCCCGSRNKIRRMKGADDESL